MFQRKLYQSKHHTGTVFSCLFSTFHYSFFSQVIHFTEEHRVNDYSLFLYAFFSFIIFIFFILK